MFDYLLRVLSRKGWVKSKESKESEEKSSSDLPDKSNEDKEETSKSECSNLSITINSSGISANSL